MIDEPDRPNKIRMWGVGAVCVSGLGTPLSRLRGLGGEVPFVYFPYSKVHSREDDILRPPLGAMNRGRVCSSSTSLHERSTLPSTTLDAFMTRLGASHPYLLGREV